MTTRSRIIIALDFADPVIAHQLIQQLDPNNCRLKIGKELFTLAGPQFVEQVVDKGFEVFLDLKFHDIPNTVAQACKAAAKLGVWMLNVHALGGSSMMLQAREALEDVANRPLLIAVTLLTSMGKRDLIEMGIENEPAQLVTQLAALSQRCGLDGVVCSAQEARLLRQQLGAQFKLVTPGIRLAESQADDQMRVMTPQEAILAGSDFLVIGRPITRHPDPVQALEKINQQIDAIKG